MKKIAIFVEGLTEQLFVEQLLLKIVGQKHLVIHKAKATGGKTKRRHVSIIEASTPTDTCRYLALIVDSSGDSRVASDIRERYQSLAQAGHSAIIGIRDVYPNTRAQIFQVRQQCAFRVPQAPIPVYFILGVMETESWFIAEHTHFAQIDKLLTPAATAAALTYDPASYDIQLREHPAQDLDTAYKTVGCRYIKRRDNIQRTVEVLDYAEVYLNVSTRFPDLKLLVGCIDAFLN